MKTWVACHFWGLYAGTPCRTKHENYAAAIRHLNCVKEAHKQKNRYTAYQYWIEGPNGYKESM